MYLDDVSFNVGVVAISVEVDSGLSSFTNDEAHEFISALLLFCS